MVIFTEILRLLDFIVALNRPITNAVDIPTGSVLLMLPIPQIAFLF